MKCIVLPDYGNVDMFRLEERESPRPGPGQLLIRIAGAAVNPVDTKLRSGMYKEMLPLNLPFVLGADFSGTVLAIGADVNDSWLGKRVMGMVDVMRGGAYAEEMIVDASEAVIVPDGLDLVEAAALPMGVMTGSDLVEAGLDVKAGERVAVTGAAGSVGRAAVHAAAARGAEVLAMVRSQPATPISGAVSTITASDEAAILAAGPFDCIVDTSGGDVVQTVLGAVRPGGRLCTALSVPPAVPEGKQVTAISFVVTRNTSQLARFAAAMVAGEVVLPTPALHPLEDVGEVHRRVAAGGSGRKFVLVP